MGKIVKLKNKKTGERVYPVTATKAVVDADSGERLNDVLLNKVEEAPMDGNQYVRTNGVWSVAQMATSTKEKCTISLASNQGEGDAASLYGATVKVTDADSAEVYHDGVWDGTEIALEFAPGVKYKIEVGSIADYATPETKILTALDFNIRNIVMIYNTELVNVLLTSETNVNLDGQVVIINGVEHTWKGQIISQKVAFGTTYSISIKKSEELVTPEAQENIVASQQMRNITMSYKAAYVTTIRINQTISDPSTMITRIVDDGGIEAIREKSHRYVGSVSGGFMHLRQLDDNDGTKYTDGSNANLNGSGSDVWMKLPHFWYKCKQYAEYIWDFSVAFGVKPDDEYKEWDGKDLIGVYKASSNSDGINSHSGQSINENYTYPNWLNMINSRGEGFNIVKWKHHCIMGMLFYTYYCNTNSQAILGAGSIYAATTGVSNHLGMNDSPAEGIGTDGNVNFWGLEDWWGGGLELIGNMINNKGYISVTEDNGLTREIGYLSRDTEDFYTRLIFGENVDLLGIGGYSSGSETTGFCDTQISNSLGSDYMVSRSGRGYSKYGISSLRLLEGRDYQKYPTRLVFRGEYVID